MEFQIDQLLTVTFTLFAVIDIVGSIPLLISLKEKMGGIRSIQVTLISGALMILFLFAGKPFLKILGLDIRSFAVGGSIVIFLLGLEMVLGHEIFKGDNNAKSSSVVPIAFPIIAGSGTLTTIMSLKANFEELYILLGIIINLLVVYITLRLLKVIERALGESGLLAVRKFFGVILIAIAVEIAYLCNFWGFVCAKCRKIHIIIKCCRAVWCNAIVAKINSRIYRYTW